MELALLVYVISLVKPIGVFLGITSVILCIVWPFLAIMLNFNEIPFNKTWFFIGITATVVNILIPSEKTSYTMVGAYATQKVYEDPKVQQMSGKVLKLIQDKLDSYLEEGTKK